MCSSDLLEFKAGHHSLFCNRVSTFLKPAASHTDNPLKEMAFMYVCVCVCVCMYVREGERVCVRESVCGQQGVTVRSQSM